MKMHLCCGRIGLICLLAAAAAIGSRAHTFTVLYTFTGGADGGYAAYGGLIVDAAEGTLYGTTPFGGDVHCPASPSATHPGPGCGVVFKLDPASGKETVLYTFSAAQDRFSSWTERETLKYCTNSAATTASMQVSL